VPIFTRSPILPPAALTEPAVAPVAPAPTAQPDDQPLRLLLIRTKTGELPWLVRTMALVMAPVEIVQVVGMANALWRLGHERFDSVLLDVDLTDRWVIRRCREQIADIAAVPVLDLADRAEVKAEPAVVERQSRRRSAGADPEPTRQVLRLPWQRRPRRAMDAARAEVA
jgi:hypothetical protein